MLNDDQARSWEEYIVGAIFQAGPADARLLERGDSLWFTNNAARAIFEVLQDCWCGRIPHLPAGNVASVTVAFDILCEKQNITNEQAKAQWMAYVQRITGAQYTPSNFAHGVHLLRERHAVNEMKARCDAAIRAALGGDVGGMWDQLYKKQPDDPRRDLIASNMDVTLDFAEHLQQRVETLRKRRDAPESMRTYIPSGIGPLDMYMLDGGLRPGEFGCFFGAPKTGKSIALQQITAEAGLRGDEVALITLEMQAEETLYRLDAYLTGLPNKRFRGSKLTDEEIAKWQHHAQFVAPNKIKVIPVAEDCTVATILSRLEEQRGKTGFWPRLICIDYGGIMAPLEGGNSADWQSLLQVAVEIKRLALRLGLPIWSAFQLVADAVSKEALTIKDVGFAKVGVTAQIDWGIGIIQTPTMKNDGRLELQSIVSRPGTEYDRIALCPNFNVIRIHDEHLLQQLGGIGGAVQIEGWPGGQPQIETSIAQPGPPGSPPTVTPAIPDWAYGAEHVNSSQ